MIEVINSPTASSSVATWLHWQQQLHPHSIALGLERTAAVWNRLYPAGLSCQTVLVGGTNGKGSVVAMLGAILNAAGYRVGLYTSPHLLTYNERICINGQLVTDASLCAAFARVEQARGNIPLTYFEFGTLAALDLFAAAALDVAILEVGLGGRLDAVNIIDASVAVVTTVDLDHTDWLGTDCATIAYEKAGIFRPNHPAVIGDAKAPPALKATATAIGAQVLQAGQDFYHQAADDRWHWYGPTISLLKLPKPALQAVRQLDNAATALMVLECLVTSLPTSREAIATGLQSVRLLGRLQVIKAPITWILDVAHNVQACNYLAQDLARLAATRCIHAVFACLTDKDATGMMQSLDPQVTTWHLAQLQGPRARPVIELQQQLRACGIITPGRCYDSTTAAITGAMAEAKIGDVLVITGSFLTVTEALQHPLLPAGEDD